MLRPVASPPSRNPAPGEADEPLALGPVLVAHRSDMCNRSLETARLSEPRGEFMALYFPVGSEAGRRDDNRVIEGRAATPALGRGEGVALFAPYRFLVDVLPANERLARSVVIEGLRRYLEGLLAMERDRLCHRQGDLVAEAIRSLLAAAFLPRGSERGLGVRRRFSLIDRATAHIEDHLDTSLSVESLCTSLGCSRSALYRATAPAGGVDALILERRMLAVRARLNDPGEVRAISEIAKTCGFYDIAQFNRRFKARFGAPPGTIRRDATAPARGRNAHDSAPVRSARPSPCA